MNLRLPLWSQKIVKKKPFLPPSKTKSQGHALIQTIRLLESVRSFVPKHRLNLSEQPYDAYLLNLSPLYRKSRSLYRQGGGQFLATLVSSPRTLGSAILLEPWIQYSPIEHELVWHATDRIAAQNSNDLLRLRTYSSSLFHEQNHRLLWDLLPAPPAQRQKLARFINLAESLVITSDMALADQMGTGLASLFYMIGVTYDPGTTVYEELDQRRVYRNYLQAAFRATYLNLERYDHSDIHTLVTHLFPQLGDLAERAVNRSLRLDPYFVQNTNPSWQKKHHRVVHKKLGSRPSKSVLSLPDDPLDYYQAYLIAEEWFDLIGI